ncbi:MAG: hypothetical protein PHX08_05760 [Lachnospiraceae bacterium]|nr:hypothetical protein [Lachnospiraceae bacterium]
MKRVEDVAEKDRLYDSVYKSVKNGRFAGTSDTTFSPYLGTTQRNNEMGSSDQPYCCQGLLWVWLCQLPERYRFTCCVRYIYLMYTYNEDGGLYNRVVRMHIEGNTASEEKILLDRIPQGRSITAEG